MVAGDINEYANDLEGRAIEYCWVTKGDYWL